MFISKLKFKFEKNEGNLFIIIGKGKEILRRNTYLPPSNNPWRNPHHGFYMHVCGIFTMLFQQPSIKLQPFGYQLNTNIWPLLTDSKTSVLGVVHQRNNFSVNERRERILRHHIYPTPSNDLKRNPLHWFYMHVCYTMLLHHPSI